MYPSSVAPATHCRFQQPSFVLSWSASPKIPKVTDYRFQFGLVIFFLDQPEDLFSQYKLEAFEIQIPRLLAIKHTFYAFLDLLLFARYTALLAEILVAKVEFYVAL
ncbi:hypothetical protein Ct61P_03069 [Colletotrichum tofieldiae]|nr:hypothetical protein Ct61P_03069 [Colletotrichum tofieldiae]